LDITAIAVIVLAKSVLLRFIVLADSLLEGTDMSGKVSTDQLLQLISGN
jgi:hypothetical protein